jgi:hypothetical protein
MLSKAALGSTQPPIQWVPEALTPGIKLPGRETDHSPPLVPRSRKRGSIHSVPRTPSWHNAYLVKYRDNFTFYVLYYCKISCSLFVFININYDIIASRTGSHSLGASSKKVPFVYTCVTSCIQVQACVLMNDRNFAVRQSFVSCSKELLFFI